MEEIYRPTEANKVEIYSRENQEMLGDMPHWLIHTGSYIVYGLVALLMVGSALFKYPDTVEKHIAIDDMNKVEWMTAGSTGVMDRFLVEDRTQVKRGDTLGILKNAASLKDVREFCQVLRRVEIYYETDDVKDLKRYPFDLIMGEMSSAYEQFTQAVRACVMYQEFDLYPQQRKYLYEELEILERMGKADDLAKLKVKRELFDLETNHKMEQAKNKRMLELAYENMVNSLKTWSGKYLLISRSEGTVVWGKSWGMSGRVNQGDTLCTVIGKQEGKPSGHIKLTQEEVAGISVGDRVNIELNKYPSHTYGSVTGKVESVSFVPNDKSYAVEVSLPDGLTTTNRRKVDYELGMEGKAEIVTSSRSVLSRIFGPIVELF